MFSCTISYREEITTCPCWFHYHTPVSCKAVLKQQTGISYIRCCHVIYGSRPHSTPLVVPGAASAAKRAHKICRKIVKRNTADMSCAAIVYLDKSLQEYASTSSPCTWQDRAADAQLTTRTPTVRGRLCAHCLGVTHLAGHKSCADASRCLEGASAGTSRCLLLATGLLLRCLLDSCLLLCGRSLCRLSLQNENTFVAVPKKHVLHSPMSMVRFECTLLASPF